VLGGCGPAARLSSFRPWYQHRGDIAPDNNLARRAGLQARLVEPGLAKAEGGHLDSGILDPAGRMSSGGASGKRKRELHLGLPSRGPTPAH